MPASVALGRRWLGALAAAAILAAPGGAARAQEAAAPAEMTVTLLGTGSPVPDDDRMGAATLVVAGEETLLFDAGRGVVNRLAKAGVPGRAITGVFLTHFHSDHTSDLPDLWMTSRIHIGWGDRKAALEVWGPTGTQQFMADIATAYGTDARARPKDVQIGLTGHEFAADGVVFERNGVTVTAFTVDHGVTRPAVGYRIDYKGRSVLLSGDTRYHENVVRYGTGVDLLVHEVLAARPALLEERPDLKRIFDLHTSPEQCGTVFEKARPGLAVYSHIVLFGGAAIGSDIPPPTIEELVAQTRATYQGPLQVGADLMTFDIGDTVSVRAAP